MGADILGVKEENEKRAKKFKKPLDNRRIAWYPIKRCRR